MFDDKAQMHTLEGLAAATIMLLVIVYAIEATSMTPLTSSTANVHVETELQVLGQDILGAMDYAEPGYNSKLKNDMITWNGSGYIWSGANYTEKDRPVNLTNNLTDILKTILVGQGIAHNVDIAFIDNSTLMPTTQATYMIYNGDPSENAVIISRKIVLHDGDINKTNLPDNPINDIDPSTNLYNIVDVKLVLWRM